MKRSDFLKRLGIGLGVAVVAPKTLFAEKDNISIGDTKLAIDVESISGFTEGGRGITPAEVLQLWRETGILIYSSYRGNTPIVIHGQVDVVDMENQVKL